MRPGTMNGAGTVGDRIQQQAIRMLVVSPDHGSMNRRPSMGELISACADHLPSAGRPSKTA